MYRVDIRQWFLFRRYLVQNTLLKIKPKPMDKYFSIQGFISDERIEKKKILWPWALRGVVTIFRDCDLWSPSFNWPPGVYRMLWVCHTCRDLGTNYLQLFGALTYNRKSLLGLAFADTALESMEKSGFSFEVLIVKDLQTVKYTKI